MTIKWRYSDQAEEIVRTFVTRALPDVGDWEHAVYNVSLVSDEGPRRYIVDVDLPTSTSSCWLAFEMRPTHGDALEGLVSLRAIRGDANNQEDTHVWTGIDGTWVLEPDAGE